MMILGFDQSTNKSAFSVLSDGALLRYGLLDRHKEKDVASRIKNMFLDIVRIIDEVHPDLLVFEAVQQNASPKTSLMLSQLQGMCIGAGYVKGYEVVSPLPSEWRAVLKFSQGRSVTRHELKEQAIQYAFETFGLRLQEDEAESACIAMSEWTKRRGAYGG